MKAPTTYLAAEKRLMAGKELSADQLADLLERRPKEPIPRLVLRRVIEFLRRRQSKRRGPKPRTDAAWVFLFPEIRERYETCLTQYREEHRIKRAEARKARETLPRAGETAQERALKDVLKEYRRELGGHMGPRRLRNLMSGKFSISVREEEDAPPDEFDPPDHLPKSRTVISVKRRK